MQQASLLFSPVLNTYMCWTSEYDLYNKTVEWGSSLPAKNLICSSNACKIVKIEA